MGEQSESYTSVMLSHSLGTLNPDHLIIPYAHALISLCLMPCAHALISVPDALCPLLQLRCDPCLMAHGSLGLVVHCT